jgi:hypothetical protein
MLATKNRATMTGPLALGTPGISEKIVHTSGWSRFLENSYQVPRKGLGNYDTKLALRGLSILFLIGSLSLKRSKVEPHPPSSAVTFL